MQSSSYMLQPIKPTGYHCFHFSHSLSLHRGSKEHWCYCIMPLEGTNWLHYERSWMTKFWWHHMQRSFINMHKNFKMNIFKCGTSWIQDSYSLTKLKVSFKVNKWHTKLDMFVIVPANSRFIFLLVRVDANHILVQTTTQLSNKSGHFQLQPLNLCQAGLYANISNH